MKSIVTPTFPRVLSICAATIAQLAFVAGAARAEEKVAEQNYRIATETTAAQAQATAQAGAPAARAASRAPLDFTRKGEEHPLAPVLRGLKISQEELDQNIRDYSCTFAKKERVDGEE